MIVIISYSNFVKISPWKIDFDPNNKICHCLKNDLWYVVFIERVSVIYTCFMDEIIK